MILEFAFKLKYLQFFLFLIDLYISNIISFLIAFKLVSILKENFHW